MCTKKVFLYFWVILTMQNCSIANANKLSSPPRQLIGIGVESCSEYIRIYDQFQRRNDGKGDDYPKRIETIGAYADFMGTLGGYLARMQVEAGLGQIPFQNKEQAMMLVYNACKLDLGARYIDVVDRSLAQVISKVNESQSSKSIDVGQSSSSKAVSVDAKISALFGNWICRGRYDIQISRFDDGKFILSVSPDPTTTIIQYGEFWIKDNSYFQKSTAETFSSTSAGAFPWAQSVKSSTVERSNYVTRESFIESLSLNSHSLKAKRIINWDGVHSVDASREPVERCTKTSSDFENLQRLKNGIPPHLR